MADEEFQLIAKREIDRLKQIEQLYLEQKEKVQDDSVGQFTMMLQEHMQQLHEGQASLGRSLLEYKEDQKKRLDGIFNTLKTLLELIKEVIDELSEQQRGIEHPVELDQHHDQYKQLERDIKTMQLQQEKIIDFMNKLSMLLGQLSPNHVHIQLQE